MIVLIDNYDSFSHNLYQLIGSIDPNVRVVRNDALSVEELAALHPRAIVLSPGPGKPRDAGICEQVVRELSPSIPILGVCLGHQAICEAFGGRIVHAAELMHGKSSRVKVDTDSELFAELPSEVSVGRYHSLEADPATLPACLRVTASCPNGEIMAVQHVSRPCFGVQFHPESVLTPNGAQIARNFLTYCERARVRSTYHH